MATKKVKRKSLRARLDRLVKSQVKERDNYTCQRCGKYLEGANCHASHVVPVSRSLRLAYDPMNLKVLCFHCHINWWHKHPVESGEWFQKKWPERWLYLKDKQNITGPVKDYELEELLEALNEN